MAILDFYALAKIAIEAGQLAAAKEIITAVRTYTLKNVDLESDLATVTFQKIALLYHLMGPDYALARFQEVNKLIDTIRASWSEEQRLDLSFRDPLFTALCKEDFYLATRGADTLTITEKEIAEMADEVVEL